MVRRYRLTDGSKATPHPEGEVVLYEDHRQEVERLRQVADKTSEYARAWKVFARKLAGE